MVLAAYIVFLIFLINGSDGRAAADGAIAHR